MQNYAFLWFIAHLAVYFVENTEGVFYLLTFLSKKIVLNVA
jgi:hypothetical protein